MILKLLIMLDLWLRVINLSNTKHVKRNKQRIIAFGMASNKMVNWCISGDKKGRGKHYF